MYTGTCSKEKTSFLDWVQDTYDLDVPDQRPSEDNVIRVAELINATFFPVLFTVAIFAITQGRVSDLVPAISHLCWIYAGSISWAIMSMFYFVTKSQGGLVMISHRVWFFLSFSSAIFGTVLVCKGLFRLFFVACGN